MLTYALIMHQIVYQNKIAASGPVVDEYVILYGSKFSWHNIFVNFVINLDITKILNASLECRSDRGGRMLVIGEARGMAALVLRNHTSCH